MSHGRLTRHEHVSSSDLSQIPVGDLGAELLRRLAGATDHGSRHDFEQHLHLLSQLHTVSGALMDQPENRTSVAHFAAHFQFVRHCWRNHAIPIAGATHVDIGCGSANPLARLFTHLMLGAHRVVGVDLDRPAAPADAARCLARLAAAAILDPTRLFGDYPITGHVLLANLYGFDLAKLQRGDPDGIDASRATLLHVPIEATGLASASVDLVLSHSVLEHLEDLDSALAELARITRPGGYHIHGIDTIDHRWYGEPHLHPLEFLTLETEQRMVFGCNRIRLVEFPHLFRRHGFELVDHWTQRHARMTPELRARLAAPWRSLRDDELETTWASALLRRR
jgi:SAM-dependent methyltransferase